MQEEFCYLNKFEHSYDWRIVEFDKRNEKEYMTISARVSPVSAIFVRRESRNTATTKSNSNLLMIGKEKRKLSPG
jgi:hypothetical protein